MNVANKLIKYLNNSTYRFLINSSVLGLYSVMGDEKYLFKKYFSLLGKKLDFNNATTFNEKLQWLKLYDRKPVYTTMVDKYRVKEYVSAAIGKEYVIPTIGVWDNPDDIDFDRLPNSFVLKCNHNSGLGMCICSDKSTLNISKVKKALKKGLKQDYYLTGREWPYKNVERKIIAEKYMEAESGQLIDYKVHCFNGEPRFILVCKDRFKDSGLTEDFFTTEWELMPVKRPDINQSKTPIDRPDQLEEILSLASKLSEGIPFIRVDFYIINGKVYFSELTFFPASGFEKFEPEEWDGIFGEWLHLPQ